MQTQINSGARVDGERKPRLWPGVAAVAFLWACLYVPGWIAPGSMFQLYAYMFGAMAAQLLFLVWWLFFSRVPWIDRILAIIACAAIGYGGKMLAHKTYKDFYLMFVPTYVLTVWIIWLVVSGGLRWPVRRAGLLLSFLITWGFFTLVRCEGTDGYFAPTLAFRWIPSAEEKLIAMADQANPAAVVAAKPLELQFGDWPAFRGTGRDSRLTGVTIAADWKSKPPRELWRRAVGPGWSSFTVVGKHVFTQEQNDQDEAVVCYDADTGKKIWQHNDNDRFWEAIAGPGPRATPTFHEGKLYTLGAKGRLNCLDAATGKKHWSRNIVDDSNAKIPDWGFASSPLVVQGLVTVYCGGPKKKEGEAEDEKNDKSVLAYHADTGEPAWNGGNGRASYCSLQPARLNDVEQIIISASDGLTAFEPTSGKVLWQHESKVNEQLNRVVQPTVLNKSEVLLGTGFGVGTQRVNIAYDGDKWETKEVWTTKAISPYFNDVVVFRDHVYGFDGGLLTCVSLADGGKRKWKARGYDNGQVLLLADQGVLLVQCEKGDVALVAANPDKHQELARIPALKGKTWNHPVIAHGKLFVRNGEEAVCFELKTEASDKPAGATGN
jgi:outer membrane protein assembly factor BamB